MAILCKIFEQRSSLIEKLFKYNAKKCNSASSFSGCIQRFKSKCCIALPTDGKIVRIFEKTIMSIAQFVNLYAEDLYFLTTRAGWKVTKIYDH